MIKHLHPRTDFHVAIIGCGYWGPNHIRNFNRLGNCRVTAVDLESARLERIRADFPDVELAQNYRNVLADKQIDCVVVATPTRTHFEIVRDALLAGKHVLCEKPLCTASREAEELVQLAHQRHLILMTGHVFLFNPALEKVKQEIDAGKLGTLQYLSATRTNLGPIRTDVNAAFDLATHDIAVFNWLLESIPVSVSAIGGAFLKDGNHDVVFITLKYPENQLASIHASWLNPKKVRQMTVVGSERMVTWDDLDLSTPVAIYDCGADASQEVSSYGEFLRVSMWNGDVRLPKVDSIEPLKAQFQYFIDGMEHGTIEKSNGAFSLGVVRVLEAAQESMNQGGVPVEL